MAQTQPPIKFERLATQENYDYNTGTNNLSINIPASTGFVDGTASALVLRILPTVTDANGADVIIPTSFGVPRTAGDHEVFAPCNAGALIRNAKSQGKNGFSSVQRYSNLVHENIDWYTTSSETKTAESVWRGGPLSLNYGAHKVRNGVLPQTPFITYSRPTALGSTFLTTSSQVHSGEVYIPWKNICLSGQSNQFPYIAAGDTVTSVELENVIKVMGFVPVQPNYLPQEVECDDNAAADFGAEANPILETTLYNNDMDCQECPFYVGAPVRVEYNDGAAVQNIYTTITGLKIDETTFKLNIVIADPVAAAGPRVDISVSYRAKAAAVGAQHSVSWTVEEAYAQLCKLLLSPKQMEMATKNLRDMSLSFLDYNILERTIGAGKEISDSIDIPPRTPGLAILTPQNGHLISGFDEVQRYRASINGRPMYDRDITVGRADTVRRSLHNFELKKFYANLGKRLVKYDAEAVNYDAPNNTDTHAFYPLTLPLLDVGQTVNMRLNTDGVTDIASKNYYYCRFNLKQMTIKDGRVMMM